MGLISEYWGGEKNLMSELTSSATAEIDVFKKLEKRRIDLLIEINFNGLFPVGGLVKDSCENLRVLRTKFGHTGWILGGSHRNL